jgi:hypothetical protein
MARRRSKTGTRHDRPGRRGVRRSSRQRTALAVIIALVAGGFAGATLERSATPEAQTDAPPTAGVEPFARYDPSDRTAHLGQRWPRLALRTGAGGTEEIGGSDGRPKMMLLVRPGCGACDDTIATLAEHLERSGYDPATARYDLLVITIGGDTWEDRLGWRHPERSFVGDDATLTAVGFTADQLPAWFLTYPDGTLAGREQGPFTYEQYLRISTLLAATIP